MENKGENIGGKNACGIVNKGGFAEVQCQNRE
jgi:hypothetical protein